MNLVPVVEFCLVVALLICDCNAFSFVEESTDLGSGCTTVENKPGYCANLDQCDDDVKYWKSLSMNPTICEFRSNSDYTICCPAESRRSFCRNLLPQFIVHGELAGPAEFPFIAALGWTSPLDNYIDWRCGGSLISGYFVLTAAHCTRSNGVPPDVVRIGDNDLRNDTDNVYAVTMKIEKIITHPNYTRSSNYHDIAIIKLTQWVSGDRWTYPICLQNVAKLENLTATVIGYGHTEFARKNSDILMKATVPIFPNPTCHQYYDAAKRLEQGITGQQMCAGDLENDRDTCQGDSGGPLFTEDPIEGSMVFRKLVGITSFGKGCGNKSPGIYIRVSSYINWIEEIVWDPKLFEQSNS